MISEVDAIKSSNSKFKNPSVNIPSNYSSNSSITSKVSFRSSNKSSSKKQDNYKTNNFTFESEVTEESSNKKKFNQEVKINSFLEKLSPSNKEARTDPVKHDFENDLSNQLTNMFLEIENLGNNKNYKNRLLKYKENTRNKNIASFIQANSHQNSGKNTEIIQNNDDQVKKRKMSTNVRSNNNLVKNDHNTNCTSQNILETKSTKITYSSNASKRSTDLIYDSNKVNNTINNIKEEVFASSKVSFNHGNNKVLIEKECPNTILNHLLVLSNNKNNNNIKNSAIIKNPKSKI